MSATPDKRASRLPELIVLDVNETLSDISGLGDAFREVGLDDSDLEGWFAGILRDAFALTVLGDNPSFADLAGDSLRVRLAAAGSVSDPDEGARRVMERFTQLRPHPDVVPGLLALAELGCRIVTLSNGSASVARALIAATDAAPVIEHYLSVTDAGIWKPAARAYSWALEQMSVDAREAMLVAVHPWDIEGARRAGLRTGWIHRGGAFYPDYFARADVEATSMVELASLLAED